MKIAFLTSGGIAPCLAASIGALINEYSKLNTKIEFIAYLNGYRGLLMGEFITIPDDIKAKISVLYDFGGSPIGNSRVKLTNQKDCERMGYISKGQNPIEVASRQLMNDNIDILHTIGGDDTNTTAADLVSYLKINNYNLIVVGLPKTIDNDVFPIKQTLGAATAAEQGAIFFENIVNESTTSRRQLIIHEIMGRNCGWLTAKTAMQYRLRLKKRNFIPELLISKRRWDIHAIYIPEVPIDIDLEIKRLKNIMDKEDCVNIFLSEGAGIKNIVKDMTSRGKQVLKDAFGHIRLDEVNPGKWLAEKISDKIDAEKVLVQKSGYFCRSAAPNNEDLKLIKNTAKYAVNAAMDKKNGVIGLDNCENFKCISFDEIRGGKPFDINVTWFNQMLEDIGQI